MSKLKEVCELIEYCRADGCRADCRRLAKAAMVMEEALQEISALIDIYSPGSSQVDLIKIAQQSRETLAEVERIMEEKKWASFR